MDYLNDSEYKRLAEEVERHQKTLQMMPSISDPWSIVEHLHHLCALQARAGALVGETTLLRGQKEAEFIRQNRSDFDKLPPTKFSMLMSSQLHQYKALCVSADRLESDITHICDNLRTEISFIKKEAELSPKQAS